MFTQAEKSPIYTRYFALVSDSLRYAEIRSKNTGDTWIIRREGGFVETFHKPKWAKRYHFQCNSATVVSAIKKIRKHDAWKMHSSMASTSVARNRGIPAATNDFESRYDYSCSVSYKGITNASIERKGSRE